MSNINIKNKKASFEYEFIERFSAGIILTGTEIKSIREGKVSLGDSYCFFKDRELWVKNMNIAEYSYGTFSNHDPKRNRKLLLTKRELRKLEKKVEERGLTLLVIRIYIDDKNLAKVEIALARGKKLYDKRQDIKQRETKRELDRLMKN
jgi:SsrA-binding protein